MAKKLKVFHGLVNYGTQAGLFAKELRNQGIIAISVVSRDLSKRQADIELLYGGNFTQKIFRHSWNRLRRFYWFFRYNTFHFYFGQTLFRNQRDLPFYKLLGKKIVMEYLGNDIRNYKTLVSRYNLPETHDYFQNQEEHDKKIAGRIDNEKKYLNYKICCLPTHIDFAKTYNYEIDDILPLAIDLEKIKFYPLVPKDKKEKIIILHAPTSRGFKGTLYVQMAIKRLIDEGYPVILKIAEGLTHTELFDEYKKCDIFIDQISVGWYGTAALEAMAVGRPTCAYIDERYFQYIDYANEIPIININKDNITEKLRNLLQNKKTFPIIGEKSRKFIKKHHDVVNVTKKLIDIYQNKLWN